MPSFEYLVRSRAVRVTVACALIAVGLWAFLPYLTHRVASSAFVNAELLRVTAPIRGRLNVALPAKGRFIEQDTEMLMVEALVPDRRQLAVFEQQFAVAQAQVELARAQIDELAVADRRLSDRAKAHRAAVLREMDAAIGKANASNQACLIRRDELLRDLDLKRRLARTGVVSRRGLEASESAYAEAAATCDAEAAQRDQLEAERAAARDGIYVRDGGNDTPYSQQQRDRLLLRRQEVETELLREAARAEYLYGEIAKERERLTDASRFNFVLPAGHVVWAVSASPGSTVVEGQSIVDLADCTRRFVSVELPERDVESIQHGDRVDIRLLGSDRWVSGTVERMRGSAALADDRLFAAQLPKPTERQISVDVGLSPSALQDDSGRQCDIGRQAEVRFDRGLPDLLGLIGGALAATVRDD